MRYLTLLVLLLLASTARADTYWLTIGSYQKVGPAHAHSWLVLERISSEIFQHRKGSGPNGDKPPFEYSYGPQRERRCISWMPAGPILLLAGPVPGRNWSERETVEHAIRMGARITYHGPYQVDAHFYLRFIARQAELESGKWLYQALDGQGSRAGVCNCIGAISLGVLDYRLPTGLAYGERASRKIAREYERTKP